MQLVAALAAGIRGAENGTATFTLRGTASAATLYSSFEGDAFLGNVVSLNSSGAYEIYCNALVDVVVKNASDVTVISFTVGMASTDIEYDGQSFTGTPYAGGPSAASEPTTLQSVLDLWYTSSGAIDWKVSLNGSATNLSAAFAALGATTFYNVKSTAYGALGDGSTDDTSAINAAITAAGVSGGVVFFPAGTYRITSALTPNGKVHFHGVGPGESVIKMDHASNNAIAYSAGSTKRWQVIQDLRIEAMQANSGTMVLPDSGGGSLLIFRNVRLGSSSYNKHLVGSAAGYAAQCAFDHCGFDWSNTAGVAVYLDATTSSVARFTQCVINPPTNHATNQVSAGQVYAASTRFNTSGTGYSTTCINFASSNGSCVVVGCDFADPSSGTVVAFALPTVTSNTKFHEDGNSVGTSVTLYSGTFTASSGSSMVHCGTRDKRMYRMTDEGATVSIPADQYGSVVLRRATAGGATNINFVVGPPGARFTLVVYNNSGGALGALSYNNNVSDDATTDPANGNVSTYDYISAAVGGTTLCWLQCGGNNDYTPS